MRRFSDIDVVARVREALTHNRLRLDAQAIAPFNESVQKPPHFELLLRMIGRDGVALGPDTFMSAAVRYQMMADIDRWVVKRAITLLKPYADKLQSRPFVVSINFSGQSLGDDEFADFLFDSVQKSGINPRVFLLRTDRERHHPQPGACRGSDAASAAHGMRGWRWMISVRACVRCPT